MKNDIAAVLALAALLVAGAATAGDDSGNELSYGAYVDSPKRIKCLYGYVAEKTGDHAAALAIFEDCIRRWDDVYSMIWLARMIDTGVALPRDPARATALLARGAAVGAASPYGALAQYHYGIALCRGDGVARDVAAGRAWLASAMALGESDAQEALEHGDCRGDG